MGKLDLELKAISVIESCITLDQLVVAEKWARLACGELTRKVERALMNHYRGRGHREIGK